MLVLWHLEGLHTAVCFLSCMGQLSPRLWLLYYKYCVQFPFMWGSVSHTCGLYLAIISVQLQLSSACSSNLSSLSVGTKSGYKLFPLNSIERLEPSFEKGKEKPLNKVGSTIKLCTAVGLLSCSIECICASYTVYTTGGHIFPSSIFGRTCTLVETAQNVNTVVTIRQSWLVYLSNDPYWWV